ncbi:DNRLRE domain-containing protein [candidate division KSB1 bacterium]
MPNRLRFLLSVLVLIGTVSNCSDHTDYPVGYDLIGRNTNVVLHEATLFNPQISRSFSPALSPGNEPFIRLGERTDSLGTHRSITLIKFDGLPADITVNEAKLTLTVSGIHALGDLEIKAYLLDESWDQYTSNWFEAAEDRPWQANWSAPQLELENETVFNGTVNDSVVITIKAETVQGWVNQRNDTPGLALVASGGLIDFFSIQADTLHPYLRTQYVQKGETKQADFLPFWDTFISENQPGPGLQGGDNIFIGSGYPYRVMLQFDVPDSLKQILTLDARLVLTPTSTLGALIDRALRCYPAHGEWEADTTRGPSFPNDNYSIAYAETDSVSFYITPFFREWLLNYGENYGLLLLITNELDDFRGVSFDNHPGAEGRGPRIELKYYPAQEPWL